MAHRSHIRRGTWTCTSQHRSRCAFARMYMYTAQTQYISRAAGNATLRSDKAPCATQKNLQLLQIVLGPRWATQLWCGRLHAPRRSRPHRTRDARSLYQEGCGALAVLKSCRHTPHSSESVHEASQSTHLELERRSRVEVSRRPEGGRPSSRVTMSPHEPITLNTSPHESSAFLHTLVVRLLLFTLAVHEIFKLRHHKAR